MALISNCLGCVSGRRLASRFASEIILSGGRRCPWCDASNIAAAGQFRCTPRCTQQIEGIGENVCWRRLRAILGFRPRLRPKAGSILNTTLQHDSLCYGRLGAAAIHGNLWTYRNGNGRQRDGRKDCHMQGHNNCASEEATATSAAVQRTLQAAQLLREALTLLGVDPVQQMPRTARAPDRLLRLPDVERLTGLRRSAIYEQMQRGVFPRSVKAGIRAATWSETAVQAWIADRLDGRTI